MSSREKAISFSWSIFVRATNSLFFFFLFLFLTMAPQVLEKKNCASLHVSKNRDNSQVSWTWTHSVKFPAIKKVISDCAISKKKKKCSSRRIYSCFFTHNGITTPKTTREGQESTTKTSLHFAWPPKFKTQVLFTPRAQSRFLDLGLLLRGCRPKSRSLPGRVEVIQPVVRTCQRELCTNGSEKNRLFLRRMSATDSHWSCNAMSPLPVRKVHRVGSQPYHSRTMVSRCPRERSGTPFDSDMVGPSTICLPSVFVGNRSQQTTP